MTKLDNEFWHLRMKIYYAKNRPPIYEQVPCSCGRGSFFCQVEDDNCSKCNNTGTMSREVKLPDPPKIPDDFVAHMEKAYKEYVDASLSRNNCG